MRAFALTLGLLALTVQGLAPLCLASMMGVPASSAGIYSIVICTIHGYKTIQIAADGKPAPNAPDRDNLTCFMCLGCQAGTAFTAPAPVALVIPPGAASEPPALPTDFALLSRSHSPYVTRAPPAASPTAEA